VWHPYWRYAPILLILDTYGWQFDRFDLAIVDETESPFSGSVIRFSVYTRCV